MIEDEHQTITQGSDRLFCETTRSDMYISDSTVYGSDGRYGFPSDMYMFGLTINKASASLMYINGWTMEGRMNRDEKRAMQRVVKAYDRRLRTVHTEFESEISWMKDKENDKLDNMSSSFESGRVVDQINDSIQTLTNILEKADEIITALDDILSEADVSSDYKQVTRQTKVTLDKKDVSFHALLSSSLLKRLKEESQRTGLTMNEIVCRALVTELKNPD